MNYIVVDSYKELSRKAAQIIASVVTLKPDSKTIEFFDGMA